MKFVLKICGQETEAALLWLIFFVKMVHFEYFLHIADGLLAAEVTIFAHFVVVVFRIAFHEQGVAHVVFP